MRPDTWTSLQAHGRNRILS